MKIKGSVLVLGLLVVAVLLMIGGIFLSLTLTNLKILYAEGEREKAMWIAMAGISKSIWEFKSDYFSHAQQVIEENFGDGKCIRGSASLKTYAMHDSLIVSLGIYGNRKVCLAKSVKVSTITDYLIFAPKDLLLLDGYYAGPIHANGDILFVIGKGRYSNDINRSYIMKPQQIRGSALSSGGLIYISASTGDDNMKANPVDAQNANHGKREFYIGESKTLPADNPDISNYNVYYKLVDTNGPVSYPFLTYCANENYNRYAYNIFDAFDSGYMPFNRPYNDIFLGWFSERNSYQYFHYPNPDSNVPDITLEVTDPYGDKYRFIEDKNHGGYKIKVPFAENFDLVTSDYQVLIDEIKKYYADYIDKKFYYKINDANEYFINSAIATKLVIGIGDGTYDNKNLTFSLPTDYAKAIEPNYSTKNSSGKGPNDTADNFNSQRPEENNYWLNNYWKTKFNGTYCSVYLRSTYPGNIGTLTLVTEYPIREVHYTYNSVDNIISIKSEAASQEGFVSDFETDRPNWQLVADRGRVFSHASNIYGGYYNPNIHNVWTYPDDTTTDIVDSGKVGIILGGGMYEGSRPVDHVMYSTDFNGTSGTWTVLNPGTDFTTTTSIGDKDNYYSTASSQQIAFLHPNTSPNVISQSATESIPADVTTYTVTNIPMSVGESITGAGTYSINYNTGVINFTAPVPPGGATINYYHLKNTSVAITRKPLAVNCAILVDQLIKARKIDLSKLATFPDKNIIFSEIPVIVTGTPSKPVTIVSLDDIYVYNINADLPFDSLNAQPVGLISGKAIWYDFFRSNKYDENGTRLNILNKVGIYIQGRTDVFGGGEYINKSVKLIGSSSYANALVIRPVSPPAGLPVKVQYFMRAFSSTSYRTYYSSSSIYAMSFRENPPKRMPIDMEIKGMVDVFPTAGENFLEKIKPYSGASSIPEENYREIEKIINEFILSH